MKLDGDRHTLSLLRSRKRLMRAREAGHIALKWPGFLPMEKVFKDIVGISLHLEPHTP